MSRGKVRGGEARRGEARQGEARRGKARQGKARQGKPSQAKPSQAKPSQGKARQKKQRVVDALSCFTFQYNLSSKTEVNYFELHSPEEDQDAPRTPGVGLRILKPVRALHTESVVND